MKTYLADCCKAVLFIKPDRSFFSACCPGLSLNTRGQLLQSMTIVLAAFVLLQAGSVESLGSKLGFTSDAGRYVSVSLGQGQEPIAMNALTNAHKNGGWVLLQNVHLTIDWTSGPLEKKVDKLAEGAHPDFR